MSRNLRNATQHLINVVENRFEGLEIVASVPGELRAAVSLAQAAVRAEETYPMSVRLYKALKAVLLMHSAGEWTAEKRAEWERIVGGEATYKRLCDHVRKVLAEAGITEDQGDAAEG